VIYQIPIAPTHQSSKEHYRMMICRVAGAPWLPCPSTP
jgi:hypothetical protein